MITRLQRLLIASNVKETVSNGYTGVFSFRRWGNYQGFCVRLKRLSDNAIQDFGFLGDYLDIPAILLWSNGSALDFIEWYDQIGNLICKPYGTVQPPKLIIDNSQAIFDTSLGNGMRVDGISHENVKVTSAWKNTGTTANMVGCYFSSLTRLQFWKYGAQWLLGVNNSLIFQSTTSQDLIARQVVTYNSDDVNGETKIYNQSGATFTNLGNPTQTTFNLGVGINDTNGGYAGTGEIYEIIIYHDNNLVNDIEQSMVTEFL